MTAQAEALDRLIAAVEAGNEDETNDICREINKDARNAGKYWPAHDAIKAFRGSLDAAKALHDALLPGWGWMLNHMAGAARGASDGALVDAVEPFRSHGANSYNPARAWLLAILRAYRGALV